MFKKIIITSLMQLCIFSLNAEEIKPLSIQPVVQDAKWAQSWWMPRHKEKIEQKNQMKEVNLVFLGDSITHAWDETGKEFWAKSYAHRKALNLGFSGDRTEQVLWRLENGAMDGISPKLLVLMIGTNNTGHRMDKAEDTALGIKTIIETIHKKSPETKILLLAIFPRGEKPTDPQRIRNEEINKIIETYADNKKIFWQNINDKFLTTDGILEKKVMKDLLHPNKEQYPVWAEAIEANVKKLLGE